MRWINIKPRRGAQFALMLMPFVLLIVAYAFGSAARLSENANDKLLPTLSGFVQAIERMAFIADQRTGEYLFWSDTWASLIRLFAGLGISTATALLIGMLIGMLPYLRALLAPFIAVVSMVPPLALLADPLHRDRVSARHRKIALIVIGVAPDDDPRPRRCRRWTLPQRAGRQGRDAGRLLVADRLARGAAADPAAADHLPQACSWGLPGSS